ncbi:hypothetical protein, partial [Coleofasciculus chthonoplastes]|uniref:hypothetical protein n=1 Tax=Coleofasciculus chthonoplastes TaxID=64178 RepID=UPI0032FEFE7A
SLLLHGGGERMLHFCCTGEDRGCFTFVARGRTEDASLLLHGGGQRMLHFCCTGEERGCESFFGMGEERGCESFFGMGDGKGCFAFVARKGENSKPSLSSGERFGERFSRSREK